MNSNLILRNIGRFLLLVLLQLLVFNNVYLGGYINPCIYLLFIAMLPTNTGRIPMMLIAFATGFCIDLFSNMPGFHTFACTLAGFVRGIWLDKILLHDTEEAIETPSFRTVAFSQFAIYLFLLYFIFFLVYFLITIFSLRDLHTILFSALLSSIVSWILALIYQSFFLKRKKE